ncbi:membrane protein insertase YidC [Streptococcus pneumoniae]
MKKKSSLLLLSLSSLVVLTACGTSDITASTPGVWGKFVYFFAEMIRMLSFNGSTGIGIILFTLVIRTILLPVFQLQINASRKMQEIQPQMRALQEKYPGRDMESRTRLEEERQRLFKEEGVKPSAAMWPILIQMPVLLALFNALTRVEFLQQGHFLWLNLAEKDPYFILPVLAAGFTFLSTWLSNKGLVEKNGLTTGMMVIMPIIIFIFTLQVASGVALYWSTSNAYQVFQTLILSNPFKMIEERQAKEAAEKELVAKKKRAMKKAQKKKK